MDRNYFFVGPDPTAKPFVPAAQASPAGVSRTQDVDCILDQDMPHRHNSSFYEPLPELAPIGQGSQAFLDPTLGLNPVFPDGGSVMNQSLFGVSQHLRSPYFPAHAEAPLPSAAAWPLASGSIQPESWPSTMQGQPSWMMCNGLSQHSSVDLLGVKQLLSSLTANAKNAAASWCAGQVESASQIPGLGEASSHSLGIPGISGVSSSMVPGLGVLAPHQTNLHKPFLPYDISGNTNELRIPAAIPGLSTGPYSQGQLRGDGVSVRPSIRPGVQNVPLHLLSSSSARREHTSAALDPEYAALASMSGNLPYYASVLPQQQLTGPQQHPTSFTRQPLANQMLHMVPSQAHQSLAAPNVEHTLHQQQARQPPNTPPSPSKRGPVPRGSKKPSKRTKKKTKKSKANRSNKAIRGNAVESNECGNISDSLPSTQREAIRPSNYIQPSSTSQWNPIPGYINEGVHAHLSGSHQGNPSVDRRVSVSSKVGCFVPEDNRYVHGTFEHQDREEFKSQVPIFSALSAGIHTCGDRNGGYGPEPFSSHVTSAQRKLQEFSYNSVEWPNVGYHHGHSEQQDAAKLPIPAEVTHEEPRLDRRESLYPVSPLGSFINSIWDSDLKTNDSKVSSGDDDARGGLGTTSDFQEGSHSVRGALVPTVVGKPQGNVQVNTQGDVLSQLLSVGINRLSIGDERGSATLATAQRAPGESCKISESPPSWADVLKKSTMSTPEAREEGQTRLAEVQRELFKTDFAGLQTVPASSSDAMAIHSPSLMASTPDLSAILKSEKSSRNDSDRLTSGASGHKEDSDGFILVTRKNKKRNESFLDHSSPMRTSTCDNVSSVGGVSPLSRDSGLGKQLPHVKHV